MKTQNLWCLINGTHKDCLRTVTIYFQNLFFVLKVYNWKCRGKMLFCSLHTVFMKITSFRKFGIPHANWNRFLEFKGLFVTIFCGENKDYIYSLQKLNFYTLFLDRKPLTFSSTDCFLPNLSKTFWNSIKYLWKSVTF